MIVPRLEQYRHILREYMLPWRNRVLLLALMLFTSIGLQLVTPQLLASSSIRYAAIARACRWNRRPGWGPTPCRAGCC